MKYIKNALLIFGAATMLAGAGAAAMPPADLWEIGPWVRGRNYSVGMPARPVPARGGGLAMDFPTAGGEVDALTVASGPLAGARRITVRYRIEAARGTRFVAAEVPAETATVSLYFQRAGDNWTARGRYGSYRWYAPARAVLPLTPGTHTMTVAIDEPWVNVHFQPNSQDPRGYEAALAGTARVGLAFGSAGLRSHGVYATGPARFTLLSFDIE